MPFMLSSVLAFFMLASMSLRPMDLSPSKPKKLSPENGLLGVRSGMVVVNAIRKTEFGETSTLLSLLADATIAIPMMRITTVVKIMPTMVARTNLKNCFIKCYKYKYLCKLSNSIPYNIKSSIYNICYNMNDVYLLLGSNLGNREFFLQEAIQYIENEIAPIVKISSVYETQSWGKTDAP